MSSELKVDTISEKTTASGVTIDSVLIKDGEVDGIDVSTLGTWQDWTPTLNNLSIGDGTLTARYVQIGKLVVGDLKIAFGSTTSVSGDFNFTLPVSPATAGKYTATLYFIENGVQDIMGFPALSSTNFFCRVAAANSTYTTANTISNTVPFTWGTNDSIRAGFIYEVA